MGGKRQGDKKGPPNPLCLHYIGSQVLHELARIKRRLTAYAGLAIGQFAINMTAAAVQLDPKPRQALTENLSFCI
jgi:hypothetical protein